MNAKTEECLNNLQTIIQYTNEIINLAKRDVKGESFEQELSSWITLYNVKAQALNRGLQAIDALIPVPEVPKEETPAEIKEVPADDVPNEEPKARKVKKA